MKDIDLNELRIQLDDIIAEDQRYISELPSEVDIFAMFGKRKTGSPLLGRTMNHSETVPICHRSR